VVADAARQDAIDRFLPLDLRPIGVYPAVGWKLGAWHDVGYWQLALQPRPATPAPPLAPAQACALSGWAAALALPP